MTQSDFYVNHARLSIRFLGGFAVRLDTGESLLTSSKRQQQLFAYILLHRDVALSRDRIAFELWPDSTEDAARSNLRSLLHRLRQELPQPDHFLTLTDTTVAWRADAPLDLDVAHFVESLKQAQTAHALERALSLYTGPLLPAFYDDWILDLRDDLHRRYVDGLARLIELWERQSNPEAAMAAGRQLLRSDRLHEENTLRVMQLYARQGDRPGLEQVWQEYTQAMEEELELPPSPELTQAYLNLLHTLASESPRHNLPLVSTPFIGREEEVNTLCEQLTTPDCHLLTLVGTGGMGKTRLAMRAAEALVRKFLHGVFFVPVVNTDNPGLLPALIADVAGLSIRGDQSPDQQLLRQLRDKEMLLILDGYEHLLPQTGFIEQVLTQAPGVKLLVTSRERLNLRWEWLYSVQGLPVYAGMAASPAVSAAGAPGGGPSSAVQLFVLTAQRVQPRFSPTGEELLQIAHICQIVEGMPLGIELAASWMRMLSCSEILSQTQGGLDLLTTSLRDVPQRHRSLRAIFDQSWQLLTQGEREVFAKISVFRGGFTLAAATAVVGASLPLMASLLDKSLLRVGEHGRYDLHELVRQYGAERLAQDSAMESATRDRHMRYYADYVQEAVQSGIGTQKFADTVAAEVDNIRQAWQWAVHRLDYPTLARLILGLGYFYEVRAWRAEGEEIFSQAYRAMQPQIYPLALSAPDQKLVFASLLAWMGWFHRGRDFQKAFQIESEALDILRPLSRGLELATVLAFRGKYANDLRLYDIARRDLEECVTLLRRIGMTIGLSVPIQFLGLNYRRIGAYGEAERCHREALELSRAANVYRMTAAALDDLAGLKALKGDYEQARSLALEALAISQSSGDIHLQGVSYVNLGMAAYGMGDYAAAVAAFDASLQNSVYIEMDVHLARVLAWKSRCHLALEQPEQARSQLKRSLHTLFKPAYERAIGVVLNTAGLFLQEPYPDHARRLWQAVLDDRSLYHEDRQEAETLLGDATHSRVPSSVGSHDQAETEFPELILQTLAMIG